jgi:FkbM family methyltransferase
MEPTLVPVAQPPRPAGSWLRRSCTAIFAERRLPTRAAAALDRMLIRLGWRTKSLRVAGFDVRVRRLDADEHYVREVMVERAYSPPGYEIRETDTVVDVGGNIGALALDAGRRANRGRVVSVEPVEANFRLLCENVSRNRLPNVTPLRAAVVGTSATETTVYLSPLGSGHHTIVRPLAGNASRGETVEAVRLQDLFARYAIERCDFLKLDCEGAEFEIVENMPAEIARRIGRLAMEYHTHCDRPKREQAGRLIDMLIGLGFRIDQYTDVQGTPRGMIFARREA